MALTNMTRGHRVNVHNYAHSFDYADSPGCGFSFDCAVDGSVDLSTYAPAAVENLAACLFGLVDVVYTGIADYSHSYWQPATGTCACGRTVELVADHGHGIDCECGRIYNGSGQELRPRSQWEDRYDDDSTQPYAVEFGYAGGDW